MDATDLKPLILMWWNTSLSPVGIDRASQSDRDFVIAVICEMFKSMPIDILALGEVSSRDLIDIHAALNLPTMSCHDATALHGKTHFDIGVLYNRNRLAIDSNSSLLSSYGKSTLKLGERVTFISRDSQSKLHVFISHWPSRLHCHETHFKRTEIGTSMRQALDDIRASSEGPGCIVLMGDYNDDPCSPSLEHHLLATRDRELARSSHRFLYNPFWRLLGESTPFSDKNTPHKICGTYYYSSGEHTRWHTFDQIMFSSALLGEGPLVLNEEMCQIVRVATIESRMRTSANIFDHLPVMGALNVRRIT